VFELRRRAVASSSILLLVAACGPTPHQGGEGDAGAGGGMPEAGIASDSGGSSGGPGTAAGGSDLNGRADAGGAPPETPEGGAAGGNAPDADTCASHFATSVASFTAGPGPTTGQSALPDIVLGPPKGGGTIGGSVDVATLGNGGTITLGFAPSSIVDRPGPDFIVFENAFNVNGDATKPFAELATVEVSDDGQTFHEFPCSATTYPYGSCAGWHPVLANPDTNSVDPTDPALAGGDAFDLADLGVNEARFVRITDRVDQTGLAGTFDLDAISIVHARCP
jgi:hypothetical protein